MHRPEYIQLIEEAASILKIEVAYFANNWAIQLRKGNAIKFIVGYAFPLNDSACFKIAGNKNLCSEILTASNIANVPHQLILSPNILQKRKSKQGNFKIIQQFISENGFPLLIKKNNSSKGEGVYLLNNEPELENTLSKVYSTDASLCLSPFRANIREFRNIVLDGQCVLSYEKQIPFITGDGKSTVWDLISEFLKRNNYSGSKSGNLFDSSLVPRLKEIPKQGEKVFLQWQHNRFLGTKYEVVENNELKQLSVNAANAINGRFVSVDIIQSEKFGLEVLEINVSVGFHFPIYYPASNKSYEGELEVYLSALRKTFELE
jgi:D-alanine-D-alanine ligase-like ATP-grasp enzyme